MEEDEEGYALLRQLLRILKGDLSHKRTAFLRRPAQQLFIAFCTPQSVNDNSLVYGIAANFWGIQYGTYVIYNFTYKGLFD
jgi:hypothetical protein